MPCPSCGVPVTVGYPRCPKCQTVMPQLRTKRPTFREEHLQGGTSIEPPDAGSRAGWVLAAVLLVAGAGMAIYFATRSHARPDGPAAREPRGERAVPGEPGFDPSIEVDKPRGGPPTRDGEGGSRGGAAAEMIKRVDEALRAQRLWAKVHGEGEVLIIESSLCDDPGVMATVTDVGEVLRASGFATVRCQEPNGKVDFESAI